MPANDGKNCLHGGKKGFSYVLWDKAEIQCNYPIDKRPNIGMPTRGAGVKFTRLSKAGEEGFPGDVMIEAGYYIVPDSDELYITWKATLVEGQDKNTTTPINLTNHTYWNLSGERTIKNHVLKLPSEQYLVMDKELVPTGEIRKVEGS